MSASKITELLLSEEFTKSGKTGYDFLNYKANEVFDKYYEISCNNHDLEFIKITRLDEALLNFWSEQRGKYEINKGIKNITMHGIKLITIKE